MSENIDNVVETSRKLATVRKITDTQPIEGADAIDVATVDGWKVVVKKSEFNVNDLCIYFEIDSWVPATIAPFLNKGRTYNGVEGERLRTKKLRGQISQGLVLPLNVLQEVSSFDSILLEEGFDLTTILGVQKFEKPLAANLRGVARGNFPSFVHKTDQERIQNLKKEFENWKSTNEQWEITEKLDGSSMTVYLNNQVFGVCSRNLDLKETEDNSLWQVSRKLNLEEKMREVSGGYKNFAIQGELVGPGIQGNKYGLKELDFYVFDVFDIDTQEYLPPAERLVLIDKVMKLKHVPVFDYIYVLDDNDTIDSLLTFADGASVIGNKSAREGLVYKNMNNSHKSFKTISNKWLLKNEE